GEANTRRTPTFHGDLGHFGAEAQAPTELFDELDEPADDGARSSHREEHTVLALQKTDERVDRRCGEGISADQERMKAQHLPQFLVRDVFRYEAIHRSPALERHHRRNDARHRHRTREGCVAEHLEADSVNALAVLQEALVALD